MGRIADPSSTAGLGRSREPQPDRRRWWRKLLAGPGLAVVTILCCVLLGELLIFPLLGPSQVPRNVYQHGLVKHTAGQTGVFRIKDEVQAAFRINNQGWNSGHAVYLNERRPGKNRIVFLGDSYVEGLHVPYDRSIAEELEGSLGRDRSEAYRLGISGAPLSQSLHMLREEGLDYQPDLVVVLLVHNDFVESYRSKPGRYTSSFLKLKLSEGGEIEEIAPEPYRPDWRDRLRLTNAGRYLLYRRRLSVAGVKRLLLPRAETAPPSEAPTAQAGPRPGEGLTPSTATAADPLAELRQISRYLFAQLQRESERAGAELVLVMDGDRKAIYRGVPPGPVHSTLSRLAAQLAAQLAIPFLDLHSAFLQEHDSCRCRFDFPSDNHWNETGHQVAARALHQFLLQRELWPPGQTSESVASIDHRERQNDPDQ